MRYIRYLAVACLTLLFAASAGARPATDSGLLTDALLRSANQDHSTVDIQSSPPMSKAGGNSEIDGHHRPGDKPPKEPKEPTPAPTPEPGTLLLLGAAAAALKLHRRT